VKEMLQRHLNVDAEFTKAIMTRNQFPGSLDQSLVAAMEDEVRWMIKNNLITETNMPDFHNYIYVDGLRAVKPEAVNINR
jgi:NitT/TauT family transport system substrate-binding protein